MPKTPEETAAEYVVITNGRYPHELNDEEFTASYDQLQRVVEPLELTDREFDAYVQRARETFRLLNG